MMYNGVVVLLSNKRKREKVMKKTSLLATVTAAALMFSGCTNSNLKKTAMEIGDVKVTAGDIAVVAQTMSNMYGQSFEASMKQVPELIEISFKYGELGKAMGIELTDEEKASGPDTRAAFAAQNGGYKAYSKFVKDNGSSIEFLDDLFTASAYQTQINQKVNEEFGDEEISEEEINKYYSENYYNAKHILINKPSEDSEDADNAEDTENTEKTDDNGKTGKELAEDILARVKAGEDFDTLMKEYSEDPGLESNPDGYVFTDGEMVEPFENAVKELKPGEYGMCESDYGYHVLLRLELPEIGDNYDKVKSSCEVERRDNRIDELCEENGIKVVITQEAIDAIAEDMVKKEAVATEAPEEPTAE